VINRYAGNTGRIVRVDEAPLHLQPLAHEAPQAEKPPQPPQREAIKTPMPEKPAEKLPQPRPRSAPPPGAMRPAKSAAGIGGELSKLLGRLSPLDMETEDLILMMILYLLYKETNDKEFLIAMGAMLLL